MSSPLGNTINFFIWITLIIFGILVLFFHVENPVITIVFAASILGVLGRLGLFIANYISGILLIPLYLSKENKKTNLKNAYYYLIKVISKILRVAISLLVLMIVFRVSSSWLIYSGGVALIVYALFSSKS